MPRVNPASLTLSDYAMLHHNQQLLPMIQEVETSVTLLNTIPFKEASDTLEDVTGIKGDIPYATWVGLDKGVKANKGNWDQRKEGLANLESLAEFNRKVQKIAPNAEVARWENDQGHIEGMAQTAEKGILYGNPYSDPNQPLGIFPRFSLLTDRHGIYTLGSKEKQADYVTIDAGGGSSADGKMSSIILMAYGAGTPRLLYPRYSKDIGMAMDLGTRWDWVTDTEGGSREILRDHFQWMLGLSIADRKTVVRIANIDTTDTTCLTGLTKKIFEAFTVFKPQHRGSVRMFTTSEVILQLRGLRDSEKRANVFTERDTSPKNLYNPIDFGGYVLEECYNMLDTEDRLVATT